MKKLLLIIVLLSLAVPYGLSQEQHEKKQVLAPSFAWRMIEPLGLREEATIDTLPDNYGQRSVPSAVSSAYATTGNLGAEGINLIWSQRAPRSDFFFRDGLMAWIPSVKTMRFYNTRIPMTLLSYNTAGGRDNAQERLGVTFSGNINAKAQVGALLDYIYSKGCYANQADKDLIWGLSGSYLGDRYEMQAFYNHYNLLNKENGGITDSLYILDPALVQGGVTKVDPKTIPTRLNGAHTRVSGQELVVNNRYKVGFWEEERDDNDSVVKRTYIPVTSFIYNLKFISGKHMFRNTTPNAEFFPNTYLNPDLTADYTSYWSLQNTVGVSLLEGFNKYAKFGLAAYLTYEINKYTQTLDTLDRASIESLTPFPEGIGTIAPKGTENKAFVGAQLTKQQGSILRYSATAEFGVIGKAAGDIRVNGRIDTRLPLRFDTIDVQAYGAFHNEATPYFMRNYLSNHFIWKNDFGKERRFRVGGAITVPRTGTNISAEVENVQNYVYFNNSFLPSQHSGSIQVFTARLKQDLRFRAFNWENTVTYQTSSNDEVISLPSLAVYSNMFVKFKIATLFVQFGLDCDYYTKYYAPRYQPATASFAVQHQQKLGNYPFMNLYANLKLSKTRFYVMFSHINQGWFSKNYFSLPDYPLNPRRLQIGLSVDFAD